MKNGQLQALLSQWDELEEVIVVVSTIEDYVEDGDMLDILSEGDVSFQYGKVCITATQEEEDE